MAEGERCKREQQTGRGAMPPHTSRVPADVDYLENRTFVGRGGAEERMPENFHAKRGESRPLPFFLRSWLFVSAQGPTPPPNLAPRACVAPHADQLVMVLPERHQQYGCRVR